MSPARILDDLLSGKPPGKVVGLVTSGSDVAYCEIEVDGARYLLSVERNDEDEDGA